MENNAAMRLAWPLKPRVNDDRNEEDNHLDAACPDFLCVGAQKGGTSWLYHQLSLHPDFWMPPVKELHYFDALSKVKRPNAPRCKDGRDQWFLERITKLGAQSYIDLHGYSRLFQPKTGLLAGDITPAYSLLNDELIEQIVSYFPNLKVIFLARDPVERAWSQLSMDARVRGVPPCDTTDVNEVTRYLLNPAVFLRSYPSKIVARWRRHVCPDLFRIYFFDDLERDPAGLRRSILSFLGADPRKPSGPLSPDYNTQSGWKKLPIIAKVRSALAQFFKKELKACAAELGGPAREWPARYGFSLLIFFWELADYFDISCWCDWVA
ncbi:MAG TPA: sulfotransferase [Candidatus Udaeobacter sp.]|nr:sulfotransferase [Candidatus Udaeobacter sp.]